jgi:glycosyltransferase involved in cell wall biosynthesis
MISVICPFYNEKDSLPELVERLRKAAKDIEEPCEIIFVDDGSQDGGSEYLKSMIASNGSIRLIELESNYGKSTALQAGFKHAKGDIFVTLDADLQNPPEEIPRLLSFLKECDIVVGIRKPRHDAWLKKFCSKVANRTRRLVIGDHIEDIGCGLRIFRSETLRAFYPFRGMHRFFPAIAELEGFRIKQIPVQHDRRRWGHSKYRFRSLLLAPLLDLLAIRWIHPRKILLRTKEPQP